MIVRTFDGLQALTTPTPLWTHDNGGPLHLYDRQQAYAEIYKTQPNVRICVDFLSRNIAQLGLHVFRRISDTDRERLNDHELVRWFGKPNPATRRYRLMESLMGDLGIYFEAFWLKIRYRDQGRNAIGLVRLPPEEMQVAGGLLPTSFYWTAASSGQRREFAPTEIVYFNGYNPCNALRGLSPMETLYRILAEEAAAADQREAYWRSAGRMEGIIEQSKEAPNWTEPQLDKFRERMREFRGRGLRAGEFAMLPKGMTAKPWSFSPKDSEYIAGGKLRREVCAAQYHIPQPMVGILEHATFSNIRAQHQHTYQDTLAPWLEMIQQEIEGQLLIECADQDNVYIEFNIAAKLAGTFEERANALQVSVGKPWRTVNEARALENLPRDLDPASDRIAPQQGGPATNAAPPAADGTAAPSGPSARATPPDGETARWPDGQMAIEIGRTLEAWESRVRSHLAKFALVDRPLAFETDRWRRELHADLLGVVDEDQAQAIVEREAAALAQVLEAEALNYA